MFPSFYETEELAHLHQEDLLQESEHERLVPTVLREQKRPHTSTLVFEKLANLLMALGSRGADERTNSSPNVPSQLPIARAQNRVR